MSADPACAGSLWGTSLRIISLREFMEAFHPILPAGLFATLAHIMTALAARPALAPLDEETKLNIDAALFSVAEVVCRKAGLSQSLAMVGRIKGEFTRQIRCGDAAKAVQMLHGVVLHEIKDRALFLAPPDRGVLDNPRLFGEAVFDAFPSARMDICEAGNCWLFGRNNAVVYHLMCAAELGLRALAADRRVPTPRGPIEFEQWGTIIGLLEKEVAKIENWPRSAAREQAKEFYSSALVEARAFNNGWRTHVMHARGRAYHDDETQALMGHVRRFMQTLAVRISDGAVGPDVWPAGSAP